MVNYSIPAAKIMGLQEIRRDIEVKEALLAAEEEGARTLIEDQRSKAREAAQRLLTEHPIYQEIENLLGSPELFSSLREIWEGWEVQTETPEQTVPLFTLPILGSFGKRTIPSRVEAGPFAPIGFMPFVSSGDFSQEPKEGWDKGFSREEIEEVIEKVIKTPSEIAYMRGDVHHTHAIRGDFKFEGAGQNEIFKELTIQAYGDRPVAGAEMRLEIAINQKIAVHSLNELLVTLADLSRKDQHSSGNDLLYASCVECDGVRSYFSQFAFLMPKDLIEEAKKIKENPESNEDAGESTP